MHTRTHISKWLPGIAKEKYAETNQPHTLLQGVANVADVLKEQGGSQPVVLVSSCLVR